jgi:hypothetical protein
VSALEKEILEKFRLLDKPARQRVRDQMEQEADSSALVFSTFESLSPESALDAARELRARLHAKYGERDVISASELLSEIRDERLNDLMSGR